MQEVSVIIPNFNGMAYLDGVLAGLECQTVSNFDVILVEMDPMTEAVLLLLQGIHGSI